jgi:hypothetical protein
MSSREKKVSLVFIINGEDTAIEANTNAPLHVAVRHALQLSNNTGRDPDAWELRDSNGALIDIARTPGDFGFSSGTRLFLSLRVGAGG